MAITLVGVACFSGASGTVDLTSDDDAFDLNAVLAEDDILFAFTGSDGGLTDTEATGFTALGINTASSGDTNASYLRVGGTAPTSVAGLENVGSDGLHWFVAFRGVDWTSGPFAHSTLGKAVSSTNGDPDPAAVTTTVDNAAILVFSFLDDDLATLTTSPSGYATIATNAPTNQLQCGISGTGGTSFMAWLDDVGAAGSKNPGAWNTSGSDAWSAFTIALYPSTGGTQTTPILSYQQRSVTG